jgi:two-component system, cell cycle sensor histidine kinase and response regulator CckA
MPTQESFSKAFHSNPAPMVVSDPITGKFIDVNAQWVNLIGYSRDEMIGRRSSDLQIWGDWTVRERVVDDLVKRGSAHAIPARLLAKNGNIREVLWSAEMIDHGGDRVMLSLVYDITERRRSEETLRASEERFKRLLENSNDIVSVFDARGVRTFLGGPSARILGYEPHELVGASAFDHLHPDDIPAAEATFRGGLALPGEVRRASYRFRHKNGTWIMMETIGTNLLHDPIVRGIVLNSRDITERTRLHEQLQQSIKMEAIGRLAGGVAHDFNNLLTAIAGNAELALLELGDPTLIEESLSEILRAAQRAALLTRQLLAFSHRQIIAPKVIGLGDRVAETRTMLSRLLGEDVDLQVFARDGSSSVRIDPGQFEQVLINLAVNARDAMPDGGRLVIETSRVDLAVPYPSALSQIPAGSYVCLSVNDTGQGMSPEVKQRIFEPFFTTKPKGRGTGLGLATTFGIVKQAGGSIEVDSEPDRGTTFKIYLPRVDGVGAQPEAVPEDTDMRGHETVLLVEDDAGVRTLTCNLLKRLGYQVLAAHNGETALALVDKHTETIHLLLTDVVMPGINGRDLADRLLALRPQTKVLLMSGYNEDVVLHHGIVDQQVNFIGKPFTMQALGLKLRQILAPTSKMAATPVRPLLQGQQVEQLKVPKPG